MSWKGSELQRNEGKYDYLELLCSYVLCELRAGTNSGNHARDRILNYSSSVNFESKHPTLQLNYSISYLNCTTYVYN
jgi:hypothetical protein